MLCRAQPTHDGMQSPHQPQGMRAMILLYTGHRGSDHVTGPTAGKWHGQDLHPHLTVSDACSTSYAPQATGVRQATQMRDMWWAWQEVTEAGESWRAHAPLRKGSCFSASATSCRLRMNTPRGQVFSFQDKPVVISTSGCKIQYLSFQD